jgi:hypothetical protein
VLFNLFIIQQGETPHLVAHFMAAGAEKRLEDYHFLRNTYETVSFCG